MTPIAGTPPPSSPRSTSTPRRSQQSPSVTVSQLTVVQWMVSCWNSHYYIKSASTGHDDVIVEILRKTVCNKLRYIISQHISLIWGDLIRTNKCIILSFHYKDRCGVCVRSAEHLPSLWRLCANLKCKVELLILFNFRLKRWNWWK